jgi:hypothetical protein
VNKKIVTQIILRGGCLEFGHLSICPLDRYYRYGKVGQYQVHCDDSRYVFSGIFTDLDKAVHQFVKIGREINAFDYKESNHYLSSVPTVQNNASGRNTRSGVRKPKR